MKLWFSSVSAACVLAASALDAQEVTLYPAADASTTPVATVSRDDPRLTEGSLVVEAEAAAEGWYWGEFSGEFEGYVPDSKIGKDLLPVEGSLIRAEPDSESRILATVTADDLSEERIEVIDRGVWWTVAFRKGVPVYYQEPVIQAEPGAGSQVRPLPETETERLTATQSPLASPAASPAAALQSEVSEVAPAPSDPARMGTNPVAGSVGTSMRGTLRRASSRFFLFSPPYPFELLAPNGRRLAYVDFSEAVMRQPVSAYLGRSVTAFGTWEKLENSREIVLRARNLREEVTH